MTRLIGLAAAGHLALSGIGSAGPAVMDRTIRPEPRPDDRGSIVVAQTTGSEAQASGQKGLEIWLRDFAPRARAAGLSDDTLDATLGNLRYDPETVRRDRTQAEFTKTIWVYLDTAVSSARVDNGKKAVARHRTTLDQIATQYGVPAEVVAAIWGLESAYGAFRGNDDTLSALATLAYDGRRGAFFEDQLIEALKIIQTGDTKPSSMKGSWAGAMGHTQFMPTSFRDYAVDFDGDGRRDIWADDPTDALASTANYLKRFGWVTGQPWGVEVVLPDGFDFALTGHPIRKSPPEWAALGIRDISGQAVPDHGPASVIVPAGSRGAAFMVFQNFRVIERYNTADAYVIGVGHLSDRLRGGPAIQGDWPREWRALTFEERTEIQRRLTASGFSTQGIDGKMGPNTEAAIRDFQRSIGKVPDGYASVELLEQLR